MGIADLNNIEKGNIYFFYQPKVEHPNISGTSDVQRMFMIVHPDNKNYYRVVVIGKKKLPSPEKSGHKRYWGFISLVTEKLEKLHDEIGPQEYETRTRGERHIPSARPFGEGVYRFVQHGSHTHFAYVLELPREPAAVQEKFNVEDEASFIITIKNPQKPSPPGMSRSQPEQPEYPSELERAFENKRFSELKPVELLDYTGTEFILIASSEDIRNELGIDMQSDLENGCIADIFKDLKLDISKTVKKPLFKGEWE
ncbi:MAG TPA: hypothetical protein VHO70_11845 [Chitinispirillaceae bacterium]|nr:hypothetical protein [Chitinispirillaceae bacterium]